jgi:phage shock protein C
MMDLSKRLYRSQTNRVFSGVCGGLGEYFGLDATLIRLGFVFAAILGWFGPLLVAYLVMMIVVPEATPASRAVVDSTPEPTD